MLPCAAFGGLQCATATAGYPVEETRLRPEEIENKIGLPLCSAEVSSRISFSISAQYLDRFVPAFNHQTGAAIHLQ